MEERVDFLLAEMLDTFEFELSEIDEDPITYVADLCEYLSPELAQMPRNELRAKIKEMLK